MSTEIETTAIFNLIFFTKKKARAEYIRTIAQKVVEKFPSKLIFITLGNEGNTLKKTSTIIKSGETACDFVQVEVSGTEEKQLPFLILSQIESDLPLYIIWGEDPSENAALFEQLGKLATRIIFDSEAVTNLSKFAKTLLKLETELNCSVADLNWGRMESWRDLFTSTFYTPDRLAQLKKTEKISIFYNAAYSDFYSHPHQALYLQNWLATQLGWKLIKKEKATYLYKRDGGNVTITLYPEEQKSFKAGTIISVDVEVEGNNHFSFGRDLNYPSHVSMRLCNLEKCDIPLKYIFAKDDSGSSLVNEICHQGTSRHFLNLLENIQDRKEFAACE